MVVDLTLDLLLVLGLLVLSRPQNFKHDLLTALVPVLSEVHFGVSALINFLFDLVSLVNRHSLALGGSGVIWSSLLRGVDLLHAALRRLDFGLGRILVSHLLRENFHFLDLVDGGQLAVSGLLVGRVDALSTVLDTSLRVGLAHALWHLHRRVVHRLHNDGSLLKIRVDRLQNRV